MISRTDFNFTIILQIFENILPFAIKSIWAHWWLSKRDEVGIITTVGRYDAIKLSVWHLGSRRYKRAAIVFLYLATILPTSFLATVYEKAIGKGKSLILERNDVAKTSIFQEPGARWLSNQIVMNGRDMDDAISAMLRSDLSHTLIAKELEYTPLDAKFNATKLPGMLDEAESLKFDKLSPDGSIDLYGLYNNLAKIVGRDLKVPASTYLWIPGRMQTALYMHRLYRSEINQLPEEVRPLKQFEEHTSVVSDHRLYFEAQRNSDCSIDDSSDRPGVGEQARGRFSRNFELCREYDTQWGRLRYLLNITVAVSYVFEKDPYPEGFNYLSYSSIDVYDICNINEKLNANAPDFSKVSKLPKLFMTDGQPYSEVSLHVGVFRREHGVPLLTMQIWILVMSVVFVAGLITSLLGTYSAGATLAELIFRSEILENSDCMGNAVSLAERLMMPPSHMRASIQYRQSGTIEKGNVHVTPVMNGKRLLAFDALKSEIRAKRVEPLREIKSRDFKKTVAVAKANIDEQERNVDQMSDVRPAVMASEATVDGTGTPHARMIPAGSVLQAPRIVRSGKPVSAVRAARRAKGKSGKPAEITQSGDTAGAHVVDQPSREEDKTNNMDEVDISQEKQMHTKPV